MNAPGSVQGLLLKDPIKNPAETTASASKTGVSKECTDGGGACFCAHTGSSMNPTLCEFDLLEVAAYGESSARPGDVILFQHANKLIVHRVVNVTLEGVFTRGDNSNSVDPWILDTEMITGQVVAAWRGNRRRVIHGGLHGKVVAMILYSRLKTEGTLTTPLKPLYHALLQSGITQQLFHKWWQVDVITFQSSRHYPMQLRFGQRTIGRYDISSGRWIIRRFFRLLVDESRLPKTLAADDQSSRSRGG